MVREVGLVYGMSDEVYHADPVPGGSLSSTFARLLTEHVPAKAKARRENRRPTKSMNLGKAAHAHALGAGPELIVWQYDGRTKEGKAERIMMAPLLATEAAVAVTEADRDQILGMADLLQRDARIAPLLDGDHEVSAFWRDEQTGVWLRARFDILPKLGKPRRQTTVYDYKTTADASRRGFQKEIAKWGYHQQADFYLRAITALGIADNPKFKFIAQETEPPYLINLHECDEEAMDVARILNDRAIRLYAECTESGRWPGYAIEPTPLSLPPFYFSDHEGVLT